MNSRTCIRLGVMLGEGNNGMETCKICLMQKASDASDCHKMHVVLDEMS